MVEKDPRWRWSGVGLHSKIRQAGAETISGRRARGAGARAPGERLEAGAEIARLDG